MEETDDVHKGFEGRVGAFIERLLCQFGKDGLGVQSQPIWGLGDYLQGLLENTKGEGISWLGC